MKKFLAILLAMMLALVSVAALAEGGNEGTTGTETPATETPAEGGTTTEGESTSKTAEEVELVINEAEVSIDKSEATTPTEKQTLTINKNFTVNTYKETDKVPARRVHFEVNMDQARVTDATTVTEAPVVSIDDLVLAEGVNEGTVNINLPAFPEVGIYIYPITETYILVKDEGDPETLDMAGMTGADSMELKVSVIREDDVLKIAGIAIRENNVKTDELENQYDSGALYIKKIVSGNAGDYEAPWLFTVTFTAPGNSKVYSTINIAGDGVVKDGDSETAATLTSIAAEEEGWATKTVYVTLKHDQSIEFDNLPAGVTYTVVETEDSNYDKTEKFSNTAKEITSKTLDKAEFENKRELTPDTGIALESMPYVLMMALSLAGFVVLKLRKREEA